jgi:3',5'-cyclic AMP phosphodiesterase CpdA
MRIVCISDTHECHRDIELPRGDVLVHAGDITFLGMRPSIVRDFNAWLGEQNFRLRLVVPGNHDFPIEASREPASLLSNATLLINEGVEMFLRVLI